MLANQISLYLYRTNRVLKAIELSKEQLFLLDHKTLKNAEKELVVLLKLDPHRNIFIGYCHTNQTRLAIDSGRKLLDFTRENNLRGMEESVFLSLALCYFNQRDYNKAKDFVIKALSIATETGQKKSERECYVILIHIFIRLREYVTAKEYGEKAIAIAQENSDGIEEARWLVRLADMLLASSIDHKYVKAKEFHEKALAFAQEIGDKETEAECYEQLGRWSFLKAGIHGEDLGEAKHYYERELVLRREIGDMEGEANVHTDISGLCFLERNIPEAKLYFSASIKQREVVRSFLKDDDQSKIAYFDRSSPFFQTYQL